MICRPTAPRFRLGHHHVTLDQGEASYGISAPLGWAVVAATENECIFPSRTMVLCTLDPIGSSVGPTRVRTVSLEGPRRTKTLGRTVATVRPCWTRAYCQNVGSSCDTGPCWTREISLIDLDRSFNGLSRVLCQFNERALSAGRQWY